MTHTTFKSSLLSLGLHAGLVVIGSLFMMNNSVKTLELTGGGDRLSIALSNVSFKKSKGVSEGVASDQKDSSTAYSSGQVTKENTGEALAIGPAVTSGTASGGSSSGSAGGSDVDQGRLFSQIKNFFELRLGSTLNINVEQLVKIKLTLSPEGEILAADLVQGKLEFQVMKKVLSVAKNIPLKSYWNKTATYPQELIIPLILTPS